MHDNSELIHKMTRVYRTNLIENAYKHSDLQRYSMPRVAHIESDGESEDIPLIYNLHSQNIGRLSGTKIVPIKQLAKLKIEKSFSSLRQDNHKIQTSNQKYRATKIKRTVNKIYPKYDTKRVPSILCCDKQQLLQKYETRQISIEQDHQVRAKPTRMSNKKYRSIT